MTPPLAVIRSFDRASAECYRSVMKRIDPKRQPQHRNFRSLPRDLLDAVTGGVLERDDQLDVAVPRASEPRS
jgi:hypothetical protein